MAVNRNELVSYLYAEFKRLALTDDKHGPVVVYDQPANPHYVPLRYRTTAAPMGVPACLCKPDSAAGIARRFAHARELLTVITERA